MAVDTISDLLTRLRNAQRAHHKMVTIPSSKLAKSILEVLKKEGFIDTYKSVRPEGRKFDECQVFLRYESNGQPLATQIKRQSRPGRRRFMRVDDLPRVHNGLGISLISTSQGIMTDREARRRGIGGEVIASVF